MPLPPTGAVRRPGGVGPPGTGGRSADAHPDAAPGGGRAGRAAWPYGTPTSRGMTGASRGRPAVHPGVESRGGRGSAGGAPGGAPGLLPPVYRSAVPLAPPTRRALWRRGGAPGPCRRQGTADRYTGGEKSGGTAAVAYPFSCPRPSSTPTPGCSAPPPSTTYLAAPTRDGSPPYPGGRARHLDGPLPGTPLERRPRTGRTAPHGEPLQHEHPEPAGAVHGDGAHLQRSTRSTPAARCRARSPRCGGVPSLVGAVPRGTRYDRRGCAPTSPRPCRYPVRPPRLGPLPADRLDGECFRVVLDASR